MPVTVSQVGSAMDRAGTNDRLIAIVASFAIVAGFLLVLLQRPGSGMATQQEDRLQLRFLPRMDRIAAFPAPPAGDGARPAPTPTITTSLAAAPTASSSPAADRRPTLYAKDGRPLLPSGATGTAIPEGRPPGLANAGDGDRAKRPFDRANPIDYRETRFDKHWRGNGSAGDSALENARGSMTGMAAVIPLGDGDQPSRARPPPETRFNPGRHERLADLGSEATGDAYKAAPIASEPPPDLKGAASRIIRGQLAAIEQEYGHCRRTLLSELVAPIRLHLSQLERVEYALSHGADPVRAEHLLPREADTAYNLARRAAWHARMKLTGCR